jgi:crossover junction endodeoxyribonuclease RuvC
MQKKQFRSKKLSVEKIILGIDPGTTIMGFGVLKVVDKTMSLVRLDELLLSKYSNHYKKLEVIFNRTVEIIDTYHPDEIAIEAPFFGKNVQSMLKLGRAQGVAMAAGLSRQISITEYAPKKIKMAITGNGNASKEQVAKMIQNLLNIKGELPKNLDATDGLAAAICHFYNSGKSSIEKNYTGWNAFVKDNSKRVV